LDRVLIVPAGDPWQKSDRKVSPAFHRLEMCRLAIDGVKGLEVEDLETRRDGPTFTIDTLEAFPPDEDLVLIVGSDAATGLATWHRWEDILERATIAVAPRPGPDMGDAVGLVWIEMAPLEVSSTEIRARASQGLPFRFLVTGPVYEYITAHDLYANPPGRDMVGGLNSSEYSS